MDDTLIKQIQQRMAELPPDVRDAIQSADFGKKVQAIGAKHQLHIDQIGKLEDEVLLVMLAFSEPGDFVPNVVKQVGVPEDVADIIADEVSNDILRPIRESMRLFMEARTAQLVRSSLTETEPPPAFTPEPLPPATTTPKPVAAPAPAPVTMLSSTPITTTPPAPNVTSIKPELRTADTVLSQKTVTPPIQPPKPADVAGTPPLPSPPTTPPSATAPSVTPSNYAADPYHEPI